jgi:hypothetical protein
MKTNVFDDILCLCIDDDLTIFRREFAEIVGTLNHNGVGYFLTGSAAVSEYVNPFATTELDIQLLTHSLVDVANLLMPLDLDLVLDNDQLLIKSKQQTSRSFELLIFLHQPVSFACLHYQSGGFASVLSLQQVPVADIRLLIWYQLRYMIDGGRYDWLQYKVYLAQLLESECFTLGATRSWLKAYADAQLLNLFESAVSDMEKVKANAGLSWGEVQERKSLLHDAMSKKNIVQ